MDKEIYVVAGTNGVGKTTIKDKYLKSGIPYINTDFIARGLKKRATSLMIGELAHQYGVEQIQKYVQGDQSFAFESNLYTESSYRWFIKMKKKGYKINLLYIAVEDLEITTKRINERVMRGEHYVSPDEVMKRFKNGIHLLKQYFSLPDTLTLVDNSTISTIQLEARKGKITFIDKNLGKWVKAIIDDVGKRTIAVKEMKDKEEVREFYKKNQGNK